MQAAIADEIRQRIIAGHYAPGQRISDKALTLELGASRTPVREALLRLQSEGLIVMRPQHGTFVFAASDGDVRDICDLRGIYEAGALRLGMQHDARALSAALKACLSSAAEALRQGDLAACERGDRAFHEALIAHSGNAFLIDAYRLIADKVNVLRHRLPHTRERLATALKQHRQIAAQVARGDVAGASSALTAHVRNVYRQLTAGTEAKR